MTLSSSRVPRRRRAAAVGLLVAGLTLSVAGVTATAAPAERGRQAPAKAAAGELTAAQEQALAAGFQVAPKGSAAAAKGRPQPNPYASFVPDLTKADFATWRTRMAQAGKARAQSAGLQKARTSAYGKAAAAAPPVVWDEQEPAGTAGSNDTLANAERITVFGTGAGKKNAVRILGENADLEGGPTTALAPVPEDNGSIPLAGDTGLGAAAATRTTSGELGDGPHGPAGDDSNDFDFYEVTVPAGLALIADTSASGDVDTILAVYDETGELVAADDDGGTTGFTSRVVYTPPAAGTYYVMVAGFSFFGPLPADPFDSGSGAGLADLGPYQLSVGVGPVDADNYAVQLKPGDTIGAVGNGTATSLSVYKPNGVLAVGSPEGLDASSLYPPDSPLPGGGNTTLAYVAEEAGWYAVSVGGGTGAYQITLEGYRPGAETDRKREQTVYLDFEGGRVNTAIWGGPGVRELSPFTAFLGKWGIATNRQDAMITKITAEVRKNVRNEVRQAGLNKKLEVTVVNSRNHPEVKGKANVSRVIVGGTIDQSGIPTIGIAQFIDPGNFGHEDSALVLLDVLSDPAGDPASLNTYLTAASNRETFVAQALGNVIAHEIGHTVGSYHTDNQSDRVNLMDAGGANYQNLYGVGPDGIGGTADDPNVKFGEDDYTPDEGFSGTEDTLNVTAWAYPAS